MFQEISCAEVDVTVMKGSAVLNYCSEFDRSFLPTLSHNMSEPLTNAFCSTYQSRFPIS